MPPKARSPTPTPPSHVVVDAIPLLAQKKGFKLRQLRPHLLQLLVHIVLGHPELRHEPMNKGQLTFRAPQDTCSSRVKGKAFLTERTWEGLLRNN